MPLPGCAWFFSSAPFRCYDLKCISSPILCDAVPSSSALFCCPSLLCLAFANHLSADLFLRASMLCLCEVHRRHSLAGHLLSMLSRCLALLSIRRFPAANQILVKQFRCFFKRCFSLALRVNTLPWLLFSFPLLHSSKPLRCASVPSLCLVLLLFASATPRPATAFRRYANPLRWVSAPRYSVALPRSAKHLRSKTLLFVAIAYPIVAPRCIAFAAHLLS